MAWLAGGTLLAAVTLADPSATRMHTWPWALWTALLWLLPIGLLAACFFGAKTWRLPNRWVSLGLAGLILTAIASAWSSPFSGASLVRTWPTLGGAALVFLLHHWLTAPEADHHARAGAIGRFIAWGGALVVAVSLAGWLHRAWPEPWMHRNEAPFGHSNYTGGFIVLLFPWFIGQTLATRSAARAGWLLVNLLALIALVATSSRGAVLALGAMAGLAIVMVVARGPWTVQRKLLMAAAALVIVAGTVLANPRLRELVVQRSWGDSARESNRQRTAMIDAGLELGRQRPVFGWGPGSVPLVYPHVRMRLEGGAENVLQLHMTPLQIWATLGATGVLAIVVLSAGSFAAIFRSLRGSDRSPTAFAAAASLGGYALFTLTDHQLDVPAIAALAAIALAMLTAGHAPGPEWPLTPWRRIGVLAHVVVLLAGPVHALRRDLAARRVYEHGVVAWEQKDAPEFVHALERAAKLTPYDPFFQHHAAFQFLAVRELMSEAAGQQELTRAAINRLEGSVQTRVHEELAHFNLGWLKLERDDAIGAARHFIAAAKLVPDKGGVYFGLGLALQAAGKTEHAVRAFALEWINDPRSLTSPAWEIPSLAPLRPAVQAETLKLYGNLRSLDPRAATAEAWTRWWLGETVAPADLGPGFTAQAEAFARALPAIVNRAPLATDAAWAWLYAAWRQRDSTEAWHDLIPRDAAFAAALQRRAEAQPTEFRAFLSAPVGDESTLARAYRRQRTGYGVLAQHPDGPPITDLYVVQDNRIVADFAAPLFPPKGWLPGRFLLALLPPNPR